MTHARFETIKAVHVRRYTDASANVSAPANHSTAQRQKSSLSACGSARGEVGILRMYSEAP
jgi:hypothetical protein